MNPRWYKVLRDLGKNKGRTFLVVLSIAVGVCSFGSVFTTQEILISEMDSQYRKINAANIYFSGKTLDEGTIKWLQAQDDVREVEGLTTHTVRLISSPEERNVTLTALSNYKTDSIDKIKLPNGRAPSRGEIYFERTSEKLLGSAVGELITLELPDGKKHDLLFGGFVHDLNAIPANMFPILTAYVDMQTLKDLGLTHDYNQIGVITDPKYDTIPKLEVFADKLKNDLVDRGVKIGGVRVQKSDEHWAKDVSQAFITILTGIGFFSLFLSAFLVINTTTALLARERRQIGMMKAIGGTGKQIALVYLAVVGVYGLLALAVAVPIGMALGYANIAVITGFLNIDILNFHLPLRVFLLEALAAIGVPLIASCIPLFKGLRVSVREAVSDFQGIAKKTSRLDKLFLSLRALPRPVLLSLRNTFRNKGRLALTLGTLTIAGVLFASVINVRSSLTLEMENIFKMFNYDVDLELSGYYQKNSVVKRVKSIEGVTRVETQIATGTDLKKEDGTKGVRFPILGVEPESDFIEPTLLAGRWLSSSDRNALVITNGLRDKDPRFFVGSIIETEIEGQKHKWEVVGIILFVGDGNDLAYSTYDSLAGVLKRPGLTSNIKMSTLRHDGAYQVETAKRVEEDLRAAGIGVASRVNTEMIRAANASQFNFLIGFLLSMAVMVAIVGGLGLAGTMSLNVLERTREIGIMRGIGASNAEIRKIVLTEGLLVGLISWLLAIPLSVPASYIFDAALGLAFFKAPLTFAFDPMGLLIWLGIVLIISLIASLIPAFRASRISVREALSYE